MIQRRPPDAKALAKGFPVDQDRKPGDRRRSDTTVFLAVNDADFGLAGHASSGLQGNRKFSGSGGSTVARLKLEGIDGEVPPDVESAAQFDPTREPYQAQTRGGLTG